MGMREKLIELIRREVPPPFAERIADHLIEGGVEIPVRCKGCKRWAKDVAGCTDFVGRCEWAGYMIGATGYCVYGERKDNEC